MKEAMNLIDKGFITNPNHKHSFDVVVNTNYKGDIFYIHHYSRKN